MRAGFSVIIPTRNRAGLINAQVTRIRALPAAPDEIIVVDDGSNDSTVTDLQNLDPSLLVISTQHQGVSAARNRGAAAASHEWLIFLDDDDEPLQVWMQTFRELIRRHPDAGYVSVGFLESDGTPGVPATTGAAFHHQGASFIAGTFAVRRQHFDAVGGFDERLRFGEFTDLALRLFHLLWEEGIDIVYEAEPALRLRQRPRNERSSLRPEVFLQSGAISLEKNREHWSRDPRGHALQLSTLGVAYLRAGHLEEGRRSLWAAVRADPRSPVHLLRAVLASLPAGSIYRSR